MTEFSRMHGMSRAGRTANLRKRQRKFGYRIVSLVRLSRHRGKSERICAPTALWNKDISTFHSLKSSDSIFVQQMASISTINTGKSGNLALRGNLAGKSGPGTNLENQELESSFISDSDGLHTGKWFICVQILDRQVAQSPRLHQCGSAGDV